MHLLVGSLYHGVVAAPAWVTSMQTALSLFQASPMGASDLTTFQAALVSACSSDGTCK